MMDWIQRAAALHVWHNTLNNPPMAWLHEEAQKALDESRSKEPTPPSKPINPDDLKAARASAPPEAPPSNTTYVHPSAGVVRNTVDGLQGPAERKE